MAEVINMPRLSDTMEEGTVASWLKKVGDKVEEGDILAEIETDKATMEFESFNEGTLLHIGIEEGGTAKVDTLLAIIGEEGEDISGLLNGSTSEPKAETKSEDASDEKVTEETSESTDLPEGVIVVTMPRLSDTMEEGTVDKDKKIHGEVDIKKYYSLYFNQLSCKLPVRASENHAFYGSRPHLFPQAGLF